MSATKRFDVTISARVTDEERQNIQSLAKKNDRTSSREIGRAIRFYVSHAEEVNEALQKMG